MTTYSFLWFTLKRDEKTWKVWTAQDPSKSVTSWLIWQRHASSASSHTVGWKAAKMAEKNGEGGGGKPRSSKSSTSSRKLLPWKWERNRGTEKKRIDTFPEKKKKVLCQNKVPSYLMGLYELCRMWKNEVFTSLWMTAHNTWPDLSQYCTHKHYGCDRFKQVLWLQFNQSLVPLMVNVPADKKFQWNNTPYRLLFFYSCLSHSPGQTVGV